MEHTELYFIPLILSLLTFVAAFTTLGEYLKKKFVLFLSLVGISAYGGILDYPLMQTGQYSYYQKHYTSAEWCFKQISTNQGRYNQACALYHQGSYSKALNLFQTIRSQNPIFKSMIYYNMGNCLIHMGEFSQARIAFLKSLTLHYDPKTDQNFVAIANLSDQKKLDGRKNKQPLSAQETAQNGSPKKSKEGGGSNMQTDVASSGAGDSQKQGESDPRFSTSQGKAALSSKQYELINQRSIHESKPW